MAEGRSILIAGGNGYLGGIVGQYLVREGWKVSVLSRAARADNGPIRTIQWDGVTRGDWFGAVEGVDVLLNLAGRSVNCRYNASNRREIRTSRTASTAILGQAVAAASRPPPLWLNSSTATIYRHAEDRPQGDDGEIGSGFSVEVARAWEEAFFSAPTPLTRKIALRSAMVMGPGAGGPFNVFYTLARFGLGGAMGGGKQRVSWIHDQDFCRAIAFLIDRTGLDGTINLSAPVVPTNAEFMTELRQALGQPLGLPATRWMIQVGTWLMRTESELPLKSRWVIPTRLIDAGFRFAFEEWSTAVLDLVGRSRAGKASASGTRQVRE